MLRKYSKIAMSNNVKTSLSPMTSNICISNDKIKYTTLILFNLWTKDFTKFRLFIIEYECFFVSFKNVSKNTLSKQ